MAEKIKGRYRGVLVSSRNEDLEELQVEINQLSNSLIKIIFQYQGIGVIFRALLNEQKEGLLMVVQERTTEGYILNGMDGFVYKKNNVHGGLLYNLNSFYFHLRLNTYDGAEQELYFLGKSFKTDNV
ncbi:MAG: hypothetical protein RLO09_08930 [Cyclobacteriaceae bacterium]